MQYFIKLVHTTLNKAPTLEVEFIQKASSPNLNNRKMVTSTTNGITVRVETQYLPEHSNPRTRKYIFGYHITIENGSPFTVQLLRRKWYITDGTGNIREVEGEGVVGRQPVIAPGDAHEYLSFCNLSTEAGKMSGYYTMIKTSDGTELLVEIPEFQMFAPSLLN